MADRYRCAVCDQDEDVCTCERYCAICQGANDCRLWQDGMYYCLDCREVCDYVPQHR